MTATNEEAAQGQHAEYLGIIFEEASGIPRALTTQFKGTLSNMEGKYLDLKIGNPNTRQCDFFDCFHAQAHLYECIHWNAEETPESEYFSHRRNRDVADEFGIDSDVYRVRVKGEFPHTDSSVLINEEDLLACCTEEAKRNALKAQASKPIRNQIGIDLARYGGDENAIVVFAGHIQLKQEFYSRTDPNQAIDRAILMQEHMNWPRDKCMFVIDTSGMGEMAAAMVGSQRRMNRQMHEFYSQNSAHESEKYANKISEAWCLFAKAVRKKEIYLLYDKLTFAQLSNRLYSVDKKGRILIETKDQYKKRNEDASESGLAKSPDRADAMVLAFYEHAAMSTRAAFA